MAEWSPSAPAWVWKLAINPGAWRVLLGLWSFADHDVDGETVVYPGRAALADRLGLSERTLRTQLKWIAIAGWIKSEPGYKGYQLALRLAWSEPFEVATQPIRKTGRTDPIEGTQPIRKNDATDPPDRPNRSAKPAEPIRHTSQPHNDLTILPHSESAQASFALTGQAPEPPPSVCATDAQIDSWWVDVFNPLRIETLAEVSIGARPIECTAKHRAAIREMLGETCPGLPWPEHAECLTHVVRNAAARLLEHRGKKTSWGWQSKKAIGPAHWLHIAKNFAGYYEADAAYSSRDRDDLPEYTPDPDDPFAGMQAHEMERELM